MNFLQRENGNFVLSYCLAGTKASDKYLNKVCNNFSPCYCKVCPSAMHWLITG